MLNFYAGHAMIVEKIHENISFKQSKWLKKILVLMQKKKKIELKMNLRNTFTKN